MEYRPYTQGDSPAIEALFVAVFTESEGESEGVLVGKLAKELISGTDERDGYGFVAVDGETIVGAILFSRLTFEMKTEAFILPPLPSTVVIKGWA